MRLFIDANILLDVLMNREPYVQDSSRIWKLCEVRQAEGCVSVLTFSNLVYIMRKQLTPETIQEVLSQLRMIFSLADLTAGDVTKAAELQWPDFENALQAVIAERIHADCIITRNVRDFAKSRVAACTPTEFLDRLVHDLNGADESQ